MHRSRAIASLLLAAVLTAASVTPALGVTRTDLKKHQEAADNARDRAKKAEAAAKKLASEVASLDNEIEKIQSQADALEPKIKAASERTTRIQREVDDLKAEVSDTKQQISETQAEYDRQQKLLKSRVEETYRQGTWFYFDMLLGAHDIGDLITRTEFVSRVIESNNDIAQGLESTEKTLTRAKVKLDRSLESVKIKRREAAEVESSLRGMKAERDRAAAQRASAQAQKADLMADNKRNAKRLRALAEEEEAESDKIAAQLAAQGGSGHYGGIMAWPVPSSQRITSNFGWRICPFHGREMHPGIDVGAPQGSAIVAAGAGSVMYAGYRGGYGNTVMIDHGNGVVTLYAHQAYGGIKVGVGQRVGKGERIGTVGSTGNSTGPHLHFEVRVNGAPKNPLGYM
ncbi:MAG TPA: peptidoglycan DD-metalloendopeptidase family protein [Coriobacteriia bacterium]|nr:peptidoglycan DD-metalloendopeptidase family protein [Coriobacteriia bacterium]